MPQHSTEPDRPVEVGWAPRDLTDGREPLQWASRYPPDALKQMRLEAGYLLLHLFLVPILWGIFATGWTPPSLGDVSPSAADVAPKTIDSSKEHASANGEAYNTFFIFLSAWLGGTLGGTLFALKWLYHSRAKGMWNIDRNFWRLFTPHLSAGLSFAFVALVGSGVLTIFSTNIYSRPVLSFGVAFLIGYFSDTAVAKLSEVAETLFGPTRGKSNENDKLSRLINPNNEETRSIPNTDSNKAVQQGSSVSKDSTEVIAKLTN